MGYNAGFRPTTPFATGILNLDELHEMYFQESGKVYGIPVLILHGGPGAGIDQQQPCVFDLRTYRVIQFDQRGAGRSMPTAELSDNTTAHLIKDIEILRRHLGISQWLIMGGSWGSTLALAYAAQYPNRVSGLLLRGIFLCSKKEIQWYLQGIKNIFPEVWHQFITYLPVNERSDPIEGYRKRLHDPDPDIHHAAARAWCSYEVGCSGMLLDSNLKIAFGDQRALTLAQIQVHYFSAGFFNTENLILDNINRIRHIPTTIVQGRYDMICPIITANKLHRLCPEFEFKIVPNAGHAASEPGIHRALTNTAQQFEQRLSINKQGTYHEKSA